MRKIGANNLRVPDANVRMFKGEGKARPIKGEIEDVLEDILEVCKKKKTRAAIFFYGGGHGVEDGGLINFVTNHAESNNLIPIENMLRNVAVTSDGLIYVVAIYDMCRTD